MHRILVIDDNRAIHEDFRKILCPASAAVADLSAAEAALFGDEMPQEKAPEYEMDSAFQGQEALALVSIVAIMTILLAVLALVVVKALAESPWGLFTIAAAGGQWWTVASPLVMSGLLLYVSGVTLLEKTITERRPAYAAYQARTNAFFPWRPKSSQT